MKLEKGSGSRNGKPTCVTCGKSHYGECLKGTGSCFGCGKKGHKVRDCPTIASIGKEGNKVAQMFQRMMSKQRGISIQSRLEDRIWMLM